MSYALFNFEVMSCPRCKSSKQRIVFVTDLVEIRKVLSSVGYPADSPAGTNASAA